MVAQKAANRFQLVDPAVHERSALRVLPGLGVGTLLEAGFDLATDVCVDFHQELIGHYSDPPDGPSISRRRLLISDRISSRVSLAWQSSQR